MKARSRRTSCRENNTRRCKGKKRASTSLRSPTRRQRRQNRKTSSIPVSSKSSTRAATLTAFMARKNNRDLSAQHRVGKLETDTDRSYRTDAKDLRLGGIK